MPLQTITLGADQPSTMVPPPHQVGNNLQGNHEPIPMGNGVSILVFGVSSPSTFTLARAFIVNPDGTQTWGNTVQLTTVNQGGHGAALDATRALVIAPTGGAGLRAHVLTLNGLTLTAGAPTNFSNPPAYTGFFIGGHSVVAMNSSTVLFGYRPTNATSHVVRIQRIDVSGTTVTVDFSKALNLHEGPLFAVLEVHLVKIDATTVGAFWEDANDGSTDYGLVTLDGPFIVDESLGPVQLYDGSIYFFSFFRRIDDGFVLMLGTKIQPGPDQAVAVMLEFTLGTNFLITGPIVELTQTLPAGSSAGFSGLAVAGHQAVAVTTIPGNTFRALVLNLGTAAHEIKEVGYKDYAPGAGIAPSGVDRLATEALSPHRVLNIWKVNGGAELERMFTISVPLVPPLRWRQRDDCLTPGTATPCICFSLANTTVCIPPWWIRLTSTVQWGGRVGPMNRSY